MWCSYPVRNWHRNIRWLTTFNPPIMRALCDISISHFKPPSLLEFTFMGIQLTPPEVAPSWLVVWNIFFHILGISSSQLTNSFFSEGLRKTTNPQKIGVVHRPLLLEASPGWIQSVTARRCIQRLARRCTKWQSSTRNPRRSRRFEFVASPVRLGIEMNPAEESKRDAEKPWFEDGVFPRESMGFPHVWSVYPRVCGCWLKEPLDIRRWSVDPVELTTYQGLLGWSSSESISGAQTEKNSWYRMIAGSLTFGKITWNCQLAN